MSSSLLNACKNIVKRPDFRSNERETTRKRILPAACAWYALLFCIAKRGAATVGCRCRRCVDLTEAIEGIYGDEGPSRAGD